MKILLKLSLLIVTLSCCSTEQNQPLAQEKKQDTHRQNSGKNSSPQVVYGAELYSHEKVRYGKFVMKMKLVSQAGVVSSFFTYDNESWQGEGRPWREIDIEAVGKQVGNLQTNLITGTAQQRQHSEQVSQLAQLEQAHIYQLVWTPDQISWFVDEQVLRTTTASASQQTQDMRDLPQSYRANIWVSEVIDWVGKFHPESLPLYQLIDWIEYYNYESDGSFSLAWRDDFKQFDNQRWGKGDWSFDTNLATFAPENLQVIDGQLVLALTLGEKGIDLEHYRQQ